MNIRFYIDPKSGLPHIYNHGVDEDEVEQALANRGEDRAGDKDSRIAIGQTDATIFARNICAGSETRQRVRNYSVRTSWQAAEGIP